jgi:transcriptional regulator with XRE-family HTH domain
METPFGRRLQALRRQAGFTQKALARAAGLSTAAIAKLEGGVQGPLWRTVLLLAAILEVTPNDFLSGPARRSALAGLVSLSHPC